MTAAIKILGFDEEGRYEEEAVLLSPGVAVIADRSTFYFVRVEPAHEDGFYSQRETICDVGILSECTATVDDIPPESLTFVLWAAGQKPEVLDAVI
ncbi:hypothetical protein KQR54_18240 [Mycobacterium gordonae]|nr:hypothetical protein [Mycobacterium gordonae]